jgi:multiple antibiotic resistance protein
MDVLLDSFTRSFLMLFVLLNPFILSVYLLELVKALSFHRFAAQLLRASIISFVVFATFALTGDALFTNVLQVRFFSFLIFGGITFLIVGIRLITVGVMAVKLGPDDEQVAVSIAMPFMIGPGTISASVLAGARLTRGEALLAIALALAATLVAMLVLKWAHDVVTQYNERLVRRYTEIAGRATALFTGSFAIDMLLRGFEGWLAAIR